MGSTHLAFGQCQHSINMTGCRAAKGTYGNRAAREGFLEKEAAELRLQGEVWPAEQWEEIRASWAEGSAGMYLETERTSGWWRQGA